MFTVSALSWRAVCQCTHEDIENYIKKLQENGLAAKGFNEVLSGIRHFFKFLEVKGHIKNVPFRAEYYWKKELPVHHDRSVEYEVYMEIMQKLHLFPEHLRCMFLHLWCIGLRASEVCILKGNAYYRQGEDAWIQVYQVKMKTYKRVPIPEGLYRIMQVYLKKNQIGSDEYIFKDSHDGAFKYQTFRCQMIKFCKENGIAGGNYIFQSHDYRHTVATMFYDNEVSIQSIRDYLGHAYEEMTQQYIDYMPRKLAEANEEYFNAPEHDLAYSLRKGENDG
ncbi:MAG: site-specific integrase [Eubacteriales bacterium]|nr:site-specific integrase [Eubacteriales bacterium]